MYLRAPYDYQSVAGYFKCPCRVPRSPRTGIPRAFESGHYLPPGVACTAGLSYNPLYMEPAIRREKTLTSKSSAMLSYVKLMHHSQHWYFPQFRCNLRKISAKRYRRTKLESGSNTM